MHANSENTIEWKIDSGVIRRIRYEIQTYDGPNVFVGGWLEIEFLTGTCNRYFVSIECVGDLLCSDHPTRCLEHHIAWKCREEYNRTSKLRGHNPDWSPSGFQWVVRNAVGLSEAIEVSNKSLESHLENREWHANKHERIKEWIQRIDIFSHEIAEREILRIAVDAPLLAAISEWITPIYWQVDFGYIRRIAYHGEKHIEPNAILPLGWLEIELITGIGCKYTVPTSLR